MTHVSLEEAVRAEVERQPFSGVILVQSGDQPLLAQAYGFANRADQIPNQINTRFDIASGGKLFTGIAICQLVEQKKLTFDTLLTDCLDAAPPPFNPSITVRHLLTHSAGIPDYFDEDDPDVEIAGYAQLWAARPNYSMRSGQDYLPMIQDAEAKFAPGERLAYNNAGFILLGMIIEQITGMKFADYVRDHVFSPAGMSDSGYFPLDRLPARCAFGYIDEEDGGWHTNIYSIPVVGQGDGGPLVTAPDMARFWSALMEDRLLSPAMTKVYLTPHISAEHDAPHWHYGCGIWMMKEADEVTSYFAIGGDPGATFISEYYVKQRTHITIIGNSEAPTRSLFRAVEEVVTA